MPQSGLLVGGEFQRDQCLAFCVELRFNERAPDPSRVRIPIVRTAPDGSRTVEYMERREAERRGLQPEGKQKRDADEPDRQSPTASSLDDDVPATPVVQE